MTIETTETEGFVIWGKIPDPKPAPPPPEPESQPWVLNDEGLSRHNGYYLEHAVALPLFENAEPTGEWRVSGLRHKNDWARRWIMKANQEEAIEWCKKVDDLYRKRFDHKNGIG